MYPGNVKCLLLDSLMKVAFIVRSILFRHCMSSSKGLLTVGITITFIMIMHIGIVTSGNTLLTVLPLLMIILSHCVIKDTLRSLCFSLRGYSLNTLYVNFLALFTMNFFVILLSELDKGLET